MQVRRWIRMVTTGRMHRTVSELHSLRSEEGDVQEVKGLLEQLGLLDET